MVDTDFTTLFESIFRYVSLDGASSQNKLDSCPICCGINMYLPSYLPTYLHSSNYKGISNYLNTWKSGITA